MILGVGLEMTDIPPLQAWSEEQGEEYEGVFAPSELSYSMGKRKAGEHLAARYAAKVALLKATASAGKGVPYCEMWIERAPSGKPSLALSDAAREVLGLAPGDRLHVTLSHTGDVAVALVVWERLDSPPAPQG